MIVTLLDRGPRVLLFVLLGQQAWWASGGHPRGTGCAVIDHMFTHVRTRGVERVMTASYSLS